MRFIISLIVLVVSIGFAEAKEGGVLPVVDQDVVVFKSSTCACDAWLTDSKQCPGEASFEVSLKRNYLCHKGAVLVESPHGSWCARLGDPTQADETPLSGEVDKRTSVFLDNNKSLTGMVRMFGSSTYYRVELQITDSNRAEFLYKQGFSPNDKEMMVMKCQLTR